MSSGLGILVLAIGGFFIGLSLIYQSTRKSRLLQNIMNTPTSKIDSAAVGLVELYGEARSQKGMKSPISGMDCAYWCIVGQYFKKGRGKGWKEIFRRYSVTPFHIEDETGSMLVDPNEAQIAIPPDNVFNGSISGKNAWGPFTKLDKSAIDFIGSLDEKGKKAFMDHEGDELRIYEFYLAGGDRVYVLGNAAVARGTPSAKGPENLVIRKKDVMYISDSPEKKICETLRTEIKWNLIVGFAVSLGCAAFLVLFVTAVLDKLGY